MYKYFLLPVLTAVLMGCSHNPPPVNKLTNPPKPPPPVPPVQAMPIDPALQTQARAEIDSALHAPNEIIRAHALEMIKDVDLPSADHQIVTALGDSSPLVRKAAALAAGELRIKAATERLNENYLDAKTPERIADIFALHRLGDTSHSHELEETATDVNPYIRGDTAMILGMIGNHSALPILAHMVKTDKSPDVVLQAAEAMWKLGDERGLDELVGATVSRYPDDQMVALLALAGPHDTRVLGHIEGLMTEQYPEVTLVAARAAGMLGSDDGYGIALNGAKSVDPRQRFLAALALGAIGRADSQPVLATLLKDSDPDTRLASAGALVQVAEHAAH